ncbi:MULTISPECIES: phosphoserine phosphatase SerB [unclassified Chelatococcus]|uniref:phosphoserine phosphatase SerB n=1 Tax=unclassified Chelatococcus TaxID=2638111 RepID=UPI001BD0769A|nr:MULTISPECIES: phosphoserine phosphatase SerB [unclassified Chelatococcus]MBS7697951.1 phosphoserine phosphatase SerB [Chelatococcus sp. YT9]MBX3558472.1 phosphoserine phosphatase SerB [Chelatococcus sp.]
MTDTTQTHVATLVAAPGSDLLSDALIARVAQALPEAGLPARLDPAIAVDIPFHPAVETGADPDPRVMAKRAHVALDGLPIDVIVQRQAERRKRLFLADMDSTMIGQECIDELADFVGLKDKVATITERAMRGEIAFEPALRERVALLAGLDVGVVDRIIAERITLTPGGLTLIATLRARGAYTCLVSGGFTLFTTKIAAAIGFQENRANELLTEGSKLSGKVQEPILGREAKLATLQELREKFGLAAHEVVAIGDGANDLAMLGEAGLGVAFRAKPAVAAAAHARLDHADLTALLFAQGYRSDEFVRPTD